MSSASSFLTLPVELIDRILGLLDAEQILLSFGQVCRRFRAIARNFNRMPIKFTTKSSKKEMHRLLRLVQPENIVSVSLKNIPRSSDLMERFLHCVYICRLTHLRSLTLCEIDESDWHIIINPLIALSTIQSFSLRLNEKKEFSQESIDLLSALIAMPSLRKLTLNVSNYTSAQITWPTHCAIQELRIQSCNVEQLGQILSQSPNLRIVAVNVFDVHSDSQVDLEAPYRQLTSLTLNDIPGDMDTLEPFLSLFPSLVRLNFQTKSVLSSDFAQRFFQWEDFIGKQLALLQHFHFCFRFRTYQSVDLESILTPFCTRFWLEEKRWFVTVKHRNLSGYPLISLHSSMYVSENFSDNDCLRTTTYSTTTARSGGRSKVSKEWALSMNSCWLNSCETLRSHDFPYVNKLSLRVDGQWERNFVVRLAMLVDLTQLKEMWLFEHQEGVKLSRAIKNLLRRAPNVRILGLSMSSQFASRIKSICSTVSNRIDHLKVRVKELRDVRRMFRYVEHVRTVTFQRDESVSDFMPDVIQWLTMKQKRFHIESNGTTIVVKLDDDENQPTEVKRNHKRMKLTHRRYES